MLAGHSGTHPSPRQVPILPEAASTTSTLGAWALFLIPLFRWLLTPFPFYFPEWSPGVFQAPQFPFCIFSHFLIFSQDHLYQATGSTCYHHHHLPLAPDYRSALQIRCYRLTFSPSVVLTPGLAQAPTGYSPLPQCCLYAHIFLFITPASSL